MGVREDLIAAKALIDTPEKWVKGIHVQGGCYCAMGAIGAATKQPHGGHRWSECDKALRSLIPHMAYRHPVVSFNDDPATTHADIMALFDRAINAAGASS